MPTTKKQQGSALSVILFALLLIAVAACGYLYWKGKPNMAATSEISAPPQVAAANSCNGLVLSKGTSEGTAGTMYWHAVITNNGSQPCSLTGYPAAFMHDAKGTDVAAQSNPLYTPSAVSLAAHGGVAHVVIGLPNPANFDTSVTACTAAGSTTLKLYLPGLATPLETLFSEAACSGYTVTAIQTGA